MTKNELNALQVVYEASFGTCDDCTEEDCSNCDLRNAQTIIKGMLQRME